MKEVLVHVRQNKWVMSCGWFNQKGITKTLISSFWAAFGPLVPARPENKWNKAKTRELHMALRTAALNKGVFGYPTYINKGCYYHHSMSLAPIKSTAHFLIPNNFELYQWRIQEFMVLEERRGGEHLRNFLKKEGSIPIIYTFL